jgi:hypothetical protein
VIHHPAFQGRPTSAQFAKNGSWETAWSFTPTDCPSPATLLAYLQEAREIAFEVFFGDAFFGIRFEGTAIEVMGFARHCVESFGQSHSGTVFFTALESARNWAGLGRDIVFAEVGAVNAWKSVGAQRLPRPRNAISDFEALWANLSQTPLATEVNHKKAVEFACDVPAKHWFALPVNEASVSNLLSKSALKNALLGASA